MHAHRVAFAFALLATLSLTAACASDSPAAGSKPTAGESEALGVSTTPTAEQPLPSRSFAASLPEGYRIETVLDGLELPTSIAALPDGRLLITEQTSGRVRVVEDGRLLDEPWFELPVFVQTESFAVQELGLVTIAADPEFEENGYVYIYYTEQREGDDGRTVFARLREVDAKGGELTPLVTIDLAPVKSHIAGGIAFQGDAILLGVGDHEDHSLAPQLASPAGKVLRIDRDGEPLADNPFAGREGADPRVYAYGLRNPFGVAVDAATGKAYITENRDVEGDAVYELVAGADYGWPEHRVAFRTPLVVYDRPMGLAGITAYEDDALPEFTGDLFFCSFHGGGALHWLQTGELDPLSEVNREQVIAPGCGSGVAAGADGFIYYLDFDAGRLLRISRS